MVETGEQDPGVARSQAARVALPPPRWGGQRGLVMGIVNVTPDSFSDGGLHLDPAAAVDHGARLWAEGADLLDVGGESTRPGAACVALEDELARVIPVVRGLRRAVPEAWISVDTRRVEVARAALAEGASVVNDTSGRSDVAMAGAVAEHGARWVLMHTRGEPATMAGLTDYDDVVADVLASLAGRVEAAEAAGVPRARLWVDPGIGFAKEPGDNPKLIAALPRFAALGCAVLVGASRKRFIGALTGVAAASDRVHGSVGAALAAWARGADALRVHDVAATVQALQVFAACADA
jgi:dihydropteroate synthase